MLQDNNVNDVIAQNLADKGLEALNTSRKKPLLFIFFTLFALYQFNSLFLVDHLNKHYNGNVFLFWIFASCLIVYAIFSIYKFFNKTEISRAFKQLSAISVFILVFYSIFTYIISMIKLLDKYIVPYVNKYTHDSSLSFFLIILVFFALYNPIKKLIQFIIK